MKRKQVCDIKASKGDTSGESREKTRDWSRKQMEARMANKRLNYDFTRTRLNFEIVNGEVKEVDKKKTTEQSVREALAAHGIPHPDEAESHVKKGAKKPEKQIRNIAANIILGGSRLPMLEMAFGDQSLDLHKGADNSGLTREKRIEDWAKKNYEWLSSHKGWIVARFIVHLDETNPHVHATVIPTAWIKGKERVSYRSVFGGAKSVSSAKYKAILDDYYEKVGKDFGLERGDPKALTGNKHKSNRDYNDDLEARCADLERQNQILEYNNGQLHKDIDRLEGDKATLSQQLDELSESNRRLSGENEELKVRNAEARQELAAIITKAEGLSADMAKNMKAMKSLTSMIENKMAERGSAMQSLQTAQQQRDTGIISADDYEAVAAAAIAKVDEFDEFINQKSASLTKISSDLLQKQNDFTRLKTDYADLLGQVEDAKQFKKENSGIWKRFESAIEGRSVERSLLQTAQRLNAIPDGRSVDGLSQLAAVLKTFADGYPQKIADATNVGKRQGRNMAVSEMQTNIDRLENAVRNLGAIPGSNTDKQDMASLIGWLENLARRRKEQLENARKEGVKDAIEDISKVAGRRWKEGTTTADVGRWFKNYRDSHQRLKDYETANGKSVFDKVKDYEGLLQQHAANEEQQQREIEGLYKFLPTYNDALNAIRDTYRISDRRPTFTMDRAEAVWRLLSAASTRNECQDMADQLLEAAKESFNSNVNTVRWADAVAAVMDIVENLNPLAAVFSLDPGASIGGAGGGGNNELPRNKKDDDDFRRNLFDGIMKAGRKARSMGI